MFVFSFPKFGILVIMGSSYYIRHNFIDVEEDLTHEFKAHRCLSVRDLSSKAMAVTRTGALDRKKNPFCRSPISKNICGMLNTGKGGTIYMGVTDSGKVEGFMMCQFQKDHFLLSLQDLLASFQPPVPNHFWKVNFVRIFDKADEVICDDNKTVPVSPDLRDLPHELRESRYCWCDCFTLANMESGLMESFFVIELCLQAWDYFDTRNFTLRVDGHQNLNPLFVNEEGRCAIRRNGHTVNADLLTLQSTIATRIALTKSRLMLDSSMDSIEKCEDEADEDRDSGFQVDDHDNQSLRERQSELEGSENSSMVSYSAYEYESNFYKPPNFLEYSIPKYCALAKIVKPYGQFK